MARKKKRIVPEILRPGPIREFTPADETIYHMLQSRWFYHQTATALGFPSHCPHQRCRRRHACLVFDFSADYRVHPIKLYPGCVRNVDAVSLIVSSVEAITGMLDADIDERSDEEAMAAFRAASHVFRQEREAREGLGPRA